MISVACVRALRTEPLCQTPIPAATPDAIYEVKFWHKTEHSSQKLHQQWLTNSFTNWIVFHHLFWIFQGLGKLNNLFATISYCHISLSHLFVGNIRTYVSRTGTSTASELLRLNKELLFYFVPALSSFLWKIVRIGDGRKNINILMWNIILNIIISTTTIEYLILIFYVNVLIVYPHGYTICHHWQVKYFLWLKII